MDRNTIVLRVAVVLLTGLTSQAEVQVTVDRNTEGTPEFKFKNVPPPLQNDAAAKARFTIVDGKSDPNGSRLRALNNGRLPDEEDQPTQNFFFDAGTDGGRLQIDLGSVIAVRQVNSYSWHAADRAPQVYKLYAADGTVPGFEAAPKKDTDPEKCGWKLVASVDTRPQSGERGGQYGVSVSDTTCSLGKFRYLLFDVSRTEDRDTFGNTFYSEMDVRAVEPAEPEVPAVKIPVRAQDFEYTLDVSQVPDLKEWAESKLRPEIDKWYPIICDCLASDGFAAPKKLRVTIKPVRGVAGTSDTSVEVSAEWIKSQLQRPEWNQAIGSVIHELVHVVQQYKTRGNPGWLVEGIADYLRWFHYEPVAHQPKLKDPARAKYSDSYQTTAGFLEYAARNHDHELVVKLNAAMRQGRYSSEIWKECTGMTVQELWTQYVASLTNAAPAELPPLRLGPRPADGAVERRPRPQPTVPDGAKEVPFDETAPEPVLTEPERERGYLLFQRPLTECVHPNTRPLSHERLEALVAARKYGRIVQVCTQNRSSTLLRQTFDDLRGGQLGPIHYAHALVYRARDGIGTVSTSRCWIINLPRSSVKSAMCASPRARTRWASSGTKTVAW
jgi:hypothetical protein